MARTWFYLKLLERVLECISIIVLSLTMMGGAKKKKATKGPDANAAPVAAVRRTARKKKSGDEESGTTTSESESIATEKSNQNVCPAPSQARSRWY